MSASVTKSKDPAVPVSTHHAIVQDVRAWMLVASIVLFFFSCLITVLGSLQVPQCDQAERFSSWDVVFGAAQISSSLVAVAGAYGRQRFVLLLSLSFTSIVCLVALGIDGYSYFCFDMRDGANRRSYSCREFIEMCNLCGWMEWWKKGIDHYDDFHEGYGIRLSLLIFTAFNFVICVGIATTALTEAGRIDMCQFEEALRELQEANEQLSYRKRARRNRILTQYVSQAKPYEGQNYGVKLMHFFGFGTDVEAVPIENRKIKLIAPPPKEKET